MYFMGVVILLQYSQNIAFLVNNLTAYLYIRQYIVIPVLL